MLKHYKVTVIKALYENIQHINLKRKEFLDPAC